MTEEIGPDGPRAGADHEQFALDVAGYVLGGLTLAEQHAFEAHLATCETCRDELDQLDPVPVLLDLSASPTPAPARQPDQPPTVAEPATAPVPAPVPAHHRRRARVAAGSLAALAVAAAFVIGLMVATPHEPGYTQAVALHPAASATGAVAEPTAQGTVAVRPVDHGTEVRLSVQGLPSTAGTYYECLWWSADTVRSAGTFRITSGGTTQVELTTAAELRPGWRLAILEHPSGRSTPVTVLQTSA